MMETAHDRAMREMFERYPEAWARLTRSGLPGPWLAPCPCVTCQEQRRLERGPEMPVPMAESRRAQVLIPAPMAEMRLACGQCQAIYRHAALVRESWAQCPECGQIVQVVVQPLPAPAPPLPPFDSGPGRVAAALTEAELRMLDGPGRKVWALADAGELEMLDALCQVRAEHEGELRTAVDVGARSLTFVFTLTAKWPVRIEPPPRYGLGPVTLERGQKLEWTQRLEMLPPTRGFAAVSGPGVRQRTDVVVVVRPQRQFE